MATRRAGFGTGGMFCLEATATFGCVTRCVRPVSHTIVRQKSQTIPQRTRTARRTAIQSRIPIAEKSSTMSHFIFLTLVWGRGWLGFGEHNQTLHVMGRTSGTSDGGTGVSAPLTARWAAAVGARVHRIARRPRAAETLANGSARTTPGF